MTTTTTATTPILLPTSPILGSDGTIDLVFNTTMVAGSGTIIITDGAVQTVIDRATGQPTMRVVGATDTHTVSAASVSVDGTHVHLNVAGLLPKHQYSIVMGAGVLLSSDHVAFGGVRSTSALQFTTAGTHVESDIGIVDNGPSEEDHVTNEANQTIHFRLSAPLGDGEKIAISIDGHAVSTEQLTQDGDYWYLSSTDTQFADGVHSFSAWVVDAAGNSSAAITRQFTVDTAAPTMLTSPAGATAFAVDDALVFTFDEAVYPLIGEAISVISITDPDGNITRVDIYESNLSPDHKTLTIPASQHHLKTDTDYTLTLPGDLTDLAGNAIQNRDPIHFHTADIVPPSALSAVAQVYQGIYGIGAQIDIAIGFSEAVKVAGNGTPTLLLSNGDQAVFDHIGEDQHTMVFKYTVPARSASGTGDLQLGGGTGLVSHVSDLAGNLLDTAHIRYTHLDNLSPGGAGSPIQIDAEASPAPGAPALLAGSDTGAPADGITSVSIPSLTGSGTASFATVKLYEGDVLLATTHSDTDGKWTIAAADWVDGRQLGDGAHTLVVRQYDTANNESAASAALAISVDTSAPGKAGAPVLDAASDTGVSDHDGITSIRTPTIKGTALEAGGTIEIYEGNTLLGTAAVQADKTWSFTIGSQADRLPQFADGTHDLAVVQIDAAGNRGAVSDVLSVKVDTVAPTLLSSSGLVWNTDKHQYELKFNEKIVFATNGVIEVLDDLNIRQSHHEGNVMNNWEIAADGENVASVLELNLGSLINLLGHHFHLSANTSAVQDEAGNVAVIGTPDFTLPGILA